MALYKKNEETERGDLRIVQAACPARVQTRTNKTETGKNRIDRRSEKGGHFEKMTTTKGLAGFAAEPSPSFRVEYG